MNEQAMLARAIEIATLAHAGQFDKGGHPYILHTLHVMHKIRSSGHDITTQCIAVLHDVLEDSEEWTTDRLLSEGMSEDVVDGLSLMKHERDVDYFDYVEKMKYNLRVMHVKLEDLKHNMDPSRMKGLRQKDFERMVKYQRAYALIKQLISNHASIEAFKRENLK